MKYIVFTISVMLTLLAVVFASSKLQAETGPKNVVRFSCEVSGTESVDPALNQQGMESHEHDFYGNYDIRVDVNGWQLEQSGGPTSCNNKQATALWWTPRIKSGVRILQPRNAAPYYGGLGDQSKVIPTKVGTELIGSADKTRVLWGCGSHAERLKPPVHCEAGQFLRMKVFFQNCIKPNTQLTWHGGGNLAFRPDGQPCPLGYDRLPDTWLTVTYHNPKGVRGENLMVASHHGEWMPAETHAHADVIEGNTSPEWAALIRRCVIEPTDAEPTRPGCNTKSVLRR